MAFDIDFHERGYIKEHIREFLLFPEHWEDTANHIEVKLVWNELKFEAAQLNNVPNDKRGIYCFVVKPVFAHFFETRYLLYVGKTNRSFRIRYKDYLNDAAGIGKPRTKVYKMLKLWKDYLHFYYAHVPNGNHISSCEVKLLNTFVPKVNTDIPKAKIKPELKDIYND